MPLRSRLTEPRKPDAPGPGDDGFDRRLTYAASLAALLVFAPLLVPLVRGRILVLDDLVSFHLPMRYLYQHALTAGHSVLWTSQLFSGFYLHAEGQVGAFHPLHLLLYRTLPLAFALNMEVVLSYAFAFAGMWRFLKHAGFTSASSIVGAIAFAFSGFALLHLPHINAVAVVAHVPWLLLAIDHALSSSSRERRMGLLAISLLFASQALLGYPQYVWMSAVICLIYGAVCGRGLLLRLVLASAASVGGLLLAGVQLVPTLDLLATSARRTVGTDFALSYSLHPLNIVQLVSPYLLLARIYAAPHERMIHEYGTYSGGLATIALAWAIVRNRRLPFRHLAVFSAVTCAIGLILALGRYGGVYEWFTFVPLVGKFRAPTRHIVLLHFGLAVLAAILFEDLQRLRVTRGTTSRERKWIWLPAMLSAAMAGVAMLRPQIWSTFPDQQLYPAGMVFGLVLIAIITLLMTDGLRGSRSALTALPLVLAIDLGSWGYPYAFAGGMQTVTELAASAEPPASQPGTTVHQRARILQLNTLLLNDVRVLRPYVGLAPPRMLGLATIDELRVSGAQWLADDTDWTRIDDPMPRVRLVPDWRVVADPAELSGIDIRQIALVTEDPHASRGVVGTAKLAVDEPGRMLIDVSVRDRGLLVTTEAYDVGWRAVGGSRALHTLPVYGDYLGIAVEPGDYRMALTFEPASMRKGIYVSLAGLIAVAAVAATASWTPRRYRHE